MRYRFVFLFYLCQVNSSHYHKCSHYILLNKSLARINKNDFYLSKWLKIIKISAEMMV